MSFQAQNPGDPTALAVDTSDADTGVAGGSIEMAPTGTSDWTPFRRPLTARISSPASTTQASAVPLVPGDVVRQRRQLRQHRQATVAATARGR